MARYIWNVVRHWTADLVSDRFGKITVYGPRPLNRREFVLPEGLEERVLLSQLPMLVWENLRLGPGSTDDVMFCPSYTRPLFTRSRTVVVTHDAVSKLYPHLFPLRVRLFLNPLYGWSARNATLVITDSEAARQDIARCWKVPLSRIRVVYLAPADVFFPQPQHPHLEEIHRRHLGSSAPFFLFVGKLSGRRNIPRLLEGFAEFKRTTSHAHKLLLVGLNIHGLNLPALIAELGLSNDVIHTAYVSDEDLNLIYNAADAFVSPSTYETVSLPVLEAQATGTPVICIDTAGMREITGGAALFIPQLEAPEIAEAMARLAGDKDLRRNLSEQGLSNVKQFSWQRCSTETLAVLAEAAHN